MINKYRGFEVKRSGSREILPAGGYVAKILDVEVLRYTWGEVLNVAFDICEGEYKNFFANDYRNNTNDNKKWRGNFRLNIPDDASPYFETQQRAFNNFIWAVEETNSGYHWDWNESTLKGKGIGVLFRNKEWEMDGNTGWTTECCTVTAANDIREGKFKVPKDKPLKNITQAAAAPGFTPIEDDSDLPF